MEIVEQLRQQVASGDYRLTLHAQSELLEDGFSVDDLERGFRTAALLESYPAAQRGSCCLLNGLAVDGRSIHIVCTFGGEVVVVITVYEPKPPRWVTPANRGARK